MNVRDFIDLYSIADITSLCESLSNPHLKVVHRLLSFSLHPVPNMDGMQGVGGAAWQLHDPLVMRGY